MASGTLINTFSGNGLVPDGIKPLPEPKLTYHHRNPVAFIHSYNVNNINLHLKTSFPMLYLKSTHLKSQPHLPPNGLCVKPVVSTREAGSLDILIYPWLWWTSGLYTIHYKKRTHGSCFVVYWWGIWLVDFTHIPRDYFTYIANEQLYDCPSANDGTQKYIGECLSHKFTRTDNVAIIQKCNKAMCIFHGIYCIYSWSWMTHYLCIVVCIHVYPVLCNKAHHLSSVVIP